MLALQTSIAFAALFLQCLAQEDVWLIGHLPYTGSWPTGVAMAFGSDIMVETINNDTALLPDYRLRIVYQDGQCDASIGQTNLLRNVFSQEYMVHAPGIPVGELDVNGDGDIERDDLATLEQVWNRSQVTPAPVGLLATGSSGMTKPQVSIAYQARMPMVSGSATFPGLSNREDYPNFFRTILPDTFFLDAWVAVVRMLGHTSLASVIGETETFSDFASELVRAATAQNTTLLGIDLSAEFPGYVGLQIAMDSQSMAKEITRQLQRIKSRFVVLLVYGSRSRLLLCEAARASFLNVVYMTFGWYEWGWWRTPDTGCTPQQVFSAANGAVFANMNFARPDLDTVLTCGNGMTARQAIEMYYRRQGAEVGDQSKQPEGYYQALEGMTNMDAVCMFAMVLHELLVVRGRPLADLSARTPAIYREFVDLLSIAEYEGVQGRLRFTPGNADPEGSVVMEQLHSDEQLVAFATYRHPTFNFKGQNDLIFGFPGETFHAGPAGASSLPNDARLASFLTCPNGQMLNSSTNEGEECRFSQVFLDVLDSCACREGYYDDAGACVECAPGRYQASAGQQSCDACPPGKFSTNGASVECEICRVDTFAESEGSASCVTCDSVGVPSATLYPGSASNASCVCPAESYKPLGRDDCVRCPVAMTCAVGSDMQHLGRATDPYPQVVPGFMTRAGKPLDVYRCLAEMADQCPGGPPATCAALRDSEAVACGACEDDAYEQDGECHPCSDSGGAAALLVFVILLLLGGLAATTFAVNRNLHMQVNATLMSVTLLGLLLSGIQTMGIFKQLSIDWFEPVTTLLQVMNLLTFDIKMLKPGCLASMSVTTKFLVRQLIAPLTVPYVVVILLGKKYMKPETNLKLELSNTVGTCFSCFYISIVVSSVTPLICYRHPMTPVASSMISSPSILCFDSDDHVSMVAIGIFALCMVPLPFLAMAVLFTYHYPRYLASGHENLKAMRFLFFRFQAERYYYGVVILLRSLMLCMIPVIVRGAPSLQYWLMSALIGGFALAQMELKPWRSWMANIMDGFLCLCMNLLLLAGIMASDTMGSMEWVRIAGTVSCIIFLFSTFCGLAFGLHSRLRKGPMYDYFICHHKAAAAAQARFLKVLLLKKGSLSVFIDSDDLKALDSLFDIVKCQSATLIAYLTHDTLRRPWCAGEIATAFSTGSVKVIAVETPGFRHPTVEQLGTLDGFLDLSNCNLNEFGISLELVAEGLGKLKATQIVAVPAELTGIRVLHYVYNCIASPIFKVDQHLPVLHALPGCLVFSSNAGNLENAAAAAILEDKMRAELLRTCEHGSVMTADYQQELEEICLAVAKSRALIVVLSTGSLECVAQVAAMVTVAKLSGGDENATGGGPALIPVNCSDFIMPSASYYDAVLPKLWPGATDEATTSLRNFFKTIMVAFGTHMSDHVLDAQALEILSRVPQSFNRALSVGATSGCPITFCPDAPAQANAKDADDDALFIEEATTAV